MSDNTHRILDEFDLTKPAPLVEPASSIANSLSLSVTSTDDTSTAVLVAKFSSTFISMPLSLDNLFIWLHLLYYYLMMELL